MVYDEMGIEEIVAYINGELLKGRSMKEIERGDFGVNERVITKRLARKKIKKVDGQFVLQDGSKMPEVKKNIDIEPINIVKANQKHTANVKVAREKINKDKMDIFVDYYKETDGLVTNTPNLALTTTSADCISLLFYDPVKNVIANTHSGWRGTAQKISVNTVRKMFEEFKCEPKDIICCICPSIRKCHFEVDEDVKNIFENEFPSLMQMKEIVEKNEKTNKWHIDTVLINKLILEEVGLKPENIIDSKICTMCNSDVLHSARVEKPNYGLNTAIIEKI